MGRKLGVLGLFPCGSWVPIEHNVALAEAPYHRTKRHIDPSNRLATIQ